MEDYLLGGKHHVSQGSAVRSASREKEQVVETAWKELSLTTLYPVPASCTKWWAGASKARAKGRWGKDVFKIVFSLFYSDSVGDVVAILPESSQVFAHSHEEW